MGIERTHITARKYLITKLLELSIELCVAGNRRSVADQNAISGTDRSGQALWAPPTGGLAPCKSQFCIVSGRRGCHAGKPEPPQEVNVLNRRLHWWVI